MVAIRPCQTYEKSNHPKNIFVKLPAKERKSTRKALLPSFEESAFLLSTVWHWSFIYALQPTSRAYFKREIPPRHRPWWPASRNMNPNEISVRSTTGVPSRRCGSPVMIYNESLAKLENELSDLSNVAEAPAKYEDTTAKLFIAATQIYSSDYERRGNVRPVDVSLGCQARFFCPRT